MGKIGLDKPFCEQPATVANVPSLTLDELVPVRIKVRQLLVLPAEFTLTWEGGPVPEDRL